MTQPLLEGGGDNERLGARTVELAQEVLVGDLAARVGRLHARLALRQELPGRRQLLPLSNALRARGMEFNFDFAGKLLAAMLLLLVVSDQLTTPAADPRDGDATEAQPPRDLFGPAGGVDLRLAALEEASLLLKLAERAIPYANSPLVQAAAALGVEPSDTPQMDLSPSRRRPRRAARSATDSDAISATSSEARSNAHAAEAAAIARRSVHYEAADARCQPTLHAGFSGGALNWGPRFKVETAQECCDACRAHAAKCTDPAMAGQVYMTRRWEQQQIDERCPATMTSNEVGEYVSE